MVRDMGVMLLGITGKKVSFELSLLGLNMFGYLTSPVFLLTVMFTELAAVQLFRLAVSR